MGAVIDHHAPIHQMVWHGRRDLDGSVSAAVATIRLGSQVERKSLAGNGCESVRRADQDLRDEEWPAHNSPRHRRF